MQEIRKSAPTPFARRVQLILIVLLAGFFIVMGPTSALTAGDDTWEPTTLERGVLGIVPIIAGAMILMGLYVIGRNPRFGAGLLSGGAIVMALLWFWFFFLGIPIVALIIWYSVSRVREAERARVPRESAT